MTSSISKHSLMLALAGNFKGNNPVSHIIACCSNIGLVQAMVAGAIDMGHSNQGKKRTKQHTYLQSEEQLKVSWTEP